MCGIFIVGAQMVRNEKHYTVRILWLVLGLCVIAVIAGAIVLAAMWQ